MLSKYGCNLDYNNVTLLNSDKYKNKLSQDLETKEIFTKETNFDLNELFIQKDLSETLTRIAKYGYNEFYFADLISEQLGITPRKLIIDPEEYEEKEFKVVINEVYRIIFGRDEPYFSEVER